MTRQETQVDPGVIIRLISICGNDAYSLIDPGSTQSYISVNFSSHIDKDLSQLDSKLIISMPVGNTFVADFVFRNCDIMVEGQNLLTDLIPLNMNEFDAILGMDWLSMHGAVLDCPRKEVVFHTLDGTEVRFIGESKVIPTCMISALTAHKLLRKGCEAYLACVVTSEGSGAELTNIPVVHKFLDVFPKELLGLPPDREVEFSIDLFPGIGPIARAPYKMAPTELKELKTQL